MSSLSIELVSVAIITLLAVISPGPDFALISKVSISQGRKAGVACAMGIGAGISVHLSYTLVGLGVLMSEQVWILNTLKLMGAAYLLWLGISAFWPDIKRLSENRSQRGRGLSRREQTNDEVPRDKSKSTEAKRSRTSFFSGFICNALNPKTMLFIVALFSQVIGPNTSLSMQLGYGVYIALAHVVWFALVACLLTTNAVQSRIQNAKRWLERLSGGVMLLFGIKLVGQ